MLTALWLKPPIVGDARDMSANVLEVKANLLKVRDGRGYGWAWVIPVCPYCGRKHLHGGGPFDGNPRDFLGARMSHCRNKRYEYILVEKGE